ncbi:MAG: oligosaccharide repeat unit polymerase [Ignavibacteriaceae bacterium]|nr:oligosaccharide repeat unit polymerase [Ignavibacteriaceae bacterium]
MVITVLTFLGSIYGKYLFKKWINPLTIYCIIWGVLIFLYELKLISYPDIQPLTAFLIVSVFLSFLFGILTVTSARGIFLNQSHTSPENNLFLPIFADGGKTLKYSIIFFSLICLYAGIEIWLVLLKIFGSIPAIVLNATIVYKLNTSREIKGLTPLISIVGYVAVFFAGIYTAYNKKFTFVSIFPFIGIVIRELAVVGRAGMLLALMEFFFSFFLFRHLLTTKSPLKFRFSRTNALIVSTVVIVFFISIASLIRISRSTGENFTGASRELSQTKDDLIIAPSSYLYLSSHIGVLNQYLASEGEKTKFGQNTFLPVYQVLAKFQVWKRPPDYQKGYFIPSWTNTGTYIREFHADFGIIGTLIIPYLIGLFMTFFWFKFLENHNLYVFALLVYLFLIIGFSFLVMVTRINYWWISLTMIFISLPIIERIAVFVSNLKRE